MALDAGPLLRYVAATRASAATPVTITHVVGAAVGRVIRAHPEIGARIVFGRIRRYPTCDVGFAVDIDGGRDLAPTTVREIDTKSPVDVAREVAGGVELLRAGRDRPQRRSSSIIRWTPTVLMRPAVALSGVLVGGLGLPAFGQPGFPLGGAFVSNVGTLGLQEAYLAPVPFARVPLYLAVGAVHEAVAAVGGEPVVRDEIIITATADHRLIDGASAGRIATMLTELLEEPSRLDAPA